MECNKVFNTIGEGKRLDFIAKCYILTTNYVGDLDLFTIDEKFLASILGVDIEECIKSVWEPLR